MLTVLSSERGPLGQIEEVGVVSKFVRKFVSTGIGFREAMQLSYAMFVWLHFHILCTCACVLKQLLLFPARSAWVVYVSKIIIKKLISDCQQSPLYLDGLIGIPQKIDP